MKTHLNKIEKPALRKEVETMIINNGPYNNMTTITYKGRVINEEAVRLTNTLIHYINREIFGIKYKENKKHLEGIVIAERRMKTAKKENILHAKLKIIANKILNKYNNASEEAGVYALYLQILFKENSIFEIVDFETILHDAIKKTNNLNPKEDRFNITTEEYLCVRPIDDVKVTADDLTKAITKDYNQYSDIFEAVDEDFINFVDYYGWFI